jgi:hypothetical protein
MALPAHFASTQRDKMATLPHLISTAIRVGCVEWSKEEMGEGTTALWIPSNSAQPANIWRKYGKRRVILLRRSFGQCSTPCRPLRKAYCDAMLHKTERPIEVEMPFHLYYVIIVYGAGEMMGKWNSPIKILSPISHWFIKDQPTVPRSSGIGLPYRNPTILAMATH